MIYDVVVIGGGIVGLATAYAIQQEQPGLSLLVLEKEPTIGSHQSQHNSGVIHSGIYYKPGSLKARLTRDGNKKMIAFCKLHGLPYESCGKLIVAADDSEMAGLTRLYQFGQQNGLSVRMVDQDGLKALEPHIQGVAGIHVPVTGITDYHQVCLTLAETLRQNGVTIELSTEVMDIHDSLSGVEVETSRQTFHSFYLVNCAGLFSDRIARMTGLEPGVKIVPFRGEYYELSLASRSLIKNLVYPVPNPQMPFLGVHFTRMVDGRVEAGPNAVLAFKREGYTKSAFDVFDLWEVLTYPGFQHLVKKYWKYGLEEMTRSFYKKQFVRNLQRLLPDIHDADLSSAPAGVRAQALRPDGSLVDDFLIVYGKNTIHVCNAPSPAATASLSIGQYIANNYRTFKDSRTSLS